MVYSSLQPPENNIEVRMINNKKDFLHNFVKEIFFNKNDLFGEIFFNSKAGKFGRTGKN